MTPISLPATLQPYSATTNESRTIVAFSG
jgi:hypothetical protein